MVGAGNGAQAAGDFLPEFDHAEVAFAAVVVGRDAQVGGGGSGFGQPDSGRTAVVVDGSGKCARIDGLADSIGDQPLEGDEDVGYLCRPAPFGAAGCGVDDGLQLAQHSWCPTV